MKKNKKGFTVIEILLVLAIIGILATIVLVSLSSAKAKSQNLSVFYSLRSTADSAFACLNSQLNGVRLSAADDVTHNSLCIYDSGGTYVEEGSFSDWPDVAQKGWGTDLQASFGPDGFYWCSVSSVGATHPTNVGAYANGAYGGSTITNDFCYMLKKGDLYMWCTQSGCRKEGF